MRTGGPEGLIIIVAHVNGGLCAWKWAKCFISYNRVCVCFKELARLKCTEQAGKLEIQVRVDIIVLI